MAFNLNSKSYIASKIRQQMYLKHLREVQKINNRQADSLKKQLKEYRSISELHKNNKQIANRIKNQQLQKYVKEKNMKIYNKIKQIGCDDSLKANTMATSSGITTCLSTINIKQNSNNDEQIKQPKTQKKLETNTIIQQIVKQLVKSPRADQNTRTLHYRYRKRQQQHIQQQNTKIFKAIKEQKSMLLPLIGKHRCSSSNGNNLSLSQNPALKNDVKNSETSTTNSTYDLNLCSNNNLGKNTSQTKIQVMNNVKKRNAHERKKRYLNNCTSMSSHKINHIPAACQGQNKSGQKQQ